jgi:hypothetical protein
VCGNSESKLTSLLHDELGGNCITRTLLCLKPKTKDPKVLQVILRLSADLAKVVNFPVFNDSNFQVCNTLAMQATTTCVLSNISKRNNINIHVFYATDGVYLTLMVCT